MNYRILPILLTVLFIACPPSDMPFGGPIEGRVVDSQGNPIEDILVIKGYLRNILDGVELEETTSVHSDNFYDTTNVSGIYELPSGLEYYPISESNQSGCSSSESSSSIASSYLGFVGSKSDTLIVLFSPYASAEQDTVGFYHLYADTTIYLDSPNYEYGKEPQPFTVSDVIDHYGTLYHAASDSNEGIGLLK